jgi:hypothetical protein
MGRGGQKLLAPAPHRGAIGLYDADAPLLSGNGPGHKYGPASQSADPAAIGGKTGDLTLVYAVFCQFYGHDRINP